MFIGLFWLFSFSMPANGSGHTSLLNTKKLLKENKAGKRKRNKKDKKLNTSRNDAAYLLQF
jgi:hypothetical protein